MYGSLVSEIRKGRPVASVDATETHYTNCRIDHGGYVALRVYGFASPFKRMTWELYVVLLDGLEMFVGYANDYEAKCLNRVVS